MDPQNKPLISVVTLNYNQAGVTKEFLESFRKISYPHYEILVCDMASTEDITMKITYRGLSKRAACYCSKENLGFAGGNNWGIAQAKGDFIFIVNNDTEVTPDLLDKLIQPFFDHTRYWGDLSQNQVLGSTRHYSIRRLQSDESLYGPNLHHWRT